VNPSGDEMLTQRIDLGVGTRWSPITLNECRRVSFAPQPSGGGRTIPRPRGRAPAGLSGVELAQLPLGHTRARPPPIIPRSMVTIFI
jgi:hypothetical protein